MSLTEHLVKEECKFFTNDASFSILSYIMTIGAPQNAKYKYLKYEKANLILGTAVCLMLTVIVPTLIAIAVANATTIALVVACMSVPSFTVALINLCKLNNSHYSIIPSLYASSTIL